MTFEFLTEGGVAGHISHPSDDLSPQQFIEFYDSLLDGKLLATEKVDGLNLFVGFNRDKKVVAARNANEEPFDNPFEKFRKSHPALPAFRSGFNAIKSAMEKLSISERQTYQLMDISDEPKNFINLEIIYGEQPNLVKYSKEKNYIVFHDLRGTKDTGYERSRNLNEKDAKNILTRLANKFGTVATQQSHFDYNVSGRFPVAEKTFWLFKGPIAVLPSTVAKNEKAKQVWEKYKPQIINFGGNQEELKIFMKEVSLEVGSEILGNMKSKLADLKSDDLGIEGLVVHFNGKAYKITGKFGSFYQVLDRPPDPLSELKTLIGNKVLNVKLKELDKKKVAEYGSVSKLLLARNKKLDINAEVKERGEIQRAVERAREKLREITPSRTFERDNIQAQLYELDRFEKELVNHMTYKELAISYFNNFFWQKSKLSESLDDLLKR
jgi:hypothetical protein